jgi:methylthioribose-1-phosphate isomerase
MSNKQSIYPIVWQGDHLVLIDQTRLPREFSLVEIRRYEDCLEAVARGIIQAPAGIELAGIYGLFLGIQQFQGSSMQLLERLEIMAEKLYDRLPQHTHLHRRINPLLQQLRDKEGSTEDLKTTLLTAAQDQHRANLHCCYCLGENGLQALPSTPEQLGILTCGNVGSLATVGYGTALGVVRSAGRENRLARVYVAETRPLLEGARLTAWECVQEGIPVAVLTDGMVAWAMHEGLIQAVVVGAEVIAANGDVASSVGTYGLAVAAQTHNVPFFVVAPLATLDVTKSTGEQIAAGELETKALSHLSDLALYPPGVAVYNPRLDITPAALITAIVTEKETVAPRDLAQLI